MLAVSLLVHREQPLATAHPGARRMEGLRQVRPLLDLPQFHFHGHLRSALPGKCWVQRLCDQSVGAHLSGVLHDRADLKGDRLGIHPRDHDVLARHVELVGPHRRGLCVGGDLRHRGQRLGLSEALQGAPTTAVIERSPADEGLGQHRHQLCAATFPCDGRDRGVVCDLRLDRPHSVWRRFLSRLPDISKSCADPGSGVERLVLLVLAIRHGMRRLLLHLLDHRRGRV
mmetsp:Transcript_10262/g.29300  ORF Transcript_10262/g.29300 Transcript_10262/m.29300 type:complete len:228 (+) Transcript_10262:359-1042(+)